MRPRVKIDMKNSLAQEQRNASSSASRHSSQKPTDTCQNIQHTQRHESKRRASLKLLLSLRCWLCGTWHICGLHSSEKKKSSFWCPPEGVAYFPVFFPPAIRDKKRGQRAKKPSKKRHRNPTGLYPPCCLLTRSVSYFGVCPCEWPVWSWGLGRGKPWSRSSYGVQTA